MEGCWWNVTGSRVLEAGYPAAVPDSRVPGSRVPGGRVPVSRFWWMGAGGRVNPRLVEGGPCLAMQVAGVLEGWLS